eukprot:Rhum_TRINITY_DN15321_c6_g1::Rhum_TRINITY_DN15321_c6_g1_i1::g.151315::m.151315
MYLSRHRGTRGKRRRGFKRKGQEEKVMSLCVCGSGGVTLIFFIQKRRGLQSDTCVMGVGRVLGVLGVLGGAGDRWEGKGVEGRGGGARHSWVARCKRGTGRGMRRGISKNMNHKLSTTVSNVWWWWWWWGGGGKGVNACVGTCFFGGCVCGGGGRGGGFEPPPYFILLVRDGRSVGLLCLGREFDLFFAKCGREGERGEGEGDGVEGKNGCCMWVWIWGEGGDVLSGRCFSTGDAVLACLLVVFHWVFIGGFGLVWFGCVCCVCVCVCVLVSARILASVSCPVSRTPTAAVVTIIKRQFAMKRPRCEKEGEK